jgi:succinyl-CoA synthetase beta subunit
MSELYRGFEFDVLVSLKRGRECGGNFTARPVAAEMKERFANIYALHEVRMPIHVLNVPAGVDMETWPQQHFAEIAREEIDKIINLGQEGHG